MQFFWEKQQRLLRGVSVLGLEGRTGHTPEKWRKVLRRGNAGGRIPGVGICFGRNRLTSLWA